MDGDISALGLKPHLRGNVRNDEFFAELCSTWCDEAA
ncbi:hypothetical protein BDE36_0594 [Arcticibacter tournemirensis]|nr:hypothetical protein BDE36_0594 [Arcticibacter tournemirensis]